MAHISYGLVPWQETNYTHLDKIIPLQKWILLSFWIKNVSVNSGILPLKSLDFIYIAKTKHTKRCQSITFKIKADSQYCQTFGITSKERFKHAHSFLKIKSFAKESRKLQLLHSCFAFITKRDFSVSKVIISKERLQIVGAAIVKDRPP